MRVSKKIINGLLIIGALIAWFRPDFTDWDNASLSATAHGVFLMLIGSEWLLLIFNIVVIFIVSRRLSKSLLSAALLANPFVIQNFAEVYNKFAFLAILFFVAVNNGYPMWARLTASAIATATHPVGVFTAPLIIYELYKSGQKQLLLVAALVTTGALTLYSNEILNFVVSSKTESLETLFARIYWVEHNLDYTEMTIRFGKLFEPEYFLGLAIAVTFPLLILDFSVSPIGAQIIIFLWLAFCYKNKLLPIFALTLLIMYVLLIFNPNLGAALRNTLPMMLAVMAWSQPASGRAVTYKATTFPRMPWL